MASLMNIEDFSGLDYRTKLNKASPTSSSDALNIVLNDSREIEKRNGSEEFASSSDSVQQIIKYGSSVGDDKFLMLYKNASDKLVARSKDRSIPVNDIENTSFKFSTCEYNNVIYLADTNEANPMQKYDGGSIYRAGVPKPVCTFAIGTGTYYWRLWLSFTDTQGIEHFGDYYQTLDPSDSNPDITIDTSELGFYGGIAISSQTKTLDHANNTLELKAGHSVEVGLGMPFYDSDGNREILYITNITGDVLTFAVINGSYDIVTDDLIGCKWSAYLFFSISEWTNYTDFGKYDFQSSSPISLSLNASADFTIKLSAPLETLNMEDIYDTQLVKGLPPKCRYIDMHNNVMVAAGNYGVDEQYNKMSWSDLSVGSTVETFTPFDYENVGVTSEGQVTGIKSYFGRIAVFKLRSVYLIDGTLTTKRYTVKNYFQNMVGCVNHFSIAAYGNGVVFMSERGVYSINGNTLTEGTDLIQPVFKNADLSNSVVAIDQLRERMYFTLNSKVYVFDFYHKAWHVWSGLPTDDIMVADWGGKVRIIYTDKTNNRFTIEKDALNDFGVAISANYSSVWLDLDTPDLRKKFTELVIKSFNNSALNVNIKTEYDWTIGNTGTDLVKSTTDPIVSAQLNHDMVYSMRLILSNNTIDENMKISGYSLEYATTQQETRVR